MLLLLEVFDEFLSQFFQIFFIFPKVSCKKKCQRKRRANESTEIPRERTVVRYVFATA